MPEPTSMPPALRALIERTNLFVPDQQHPLFKENEKLWRLYLDLYELDAKKLACLVEKHHDKEHDGKFANRKRLAAVYNLIPTVVRMVTNYLFTESPAIDAGGDADLEAFLRDCDGNGTSYPNFVRETVLPMAQVLGWVDCLVQNPLVSVDAVQTAADKAAVGVRPTVYPILPIQRTNWSSQPNHRYNWVCFRERGNEDPHPLARNRKPLESYITLSAATPELDYQPSGLPADRGYWVRSWQPFKVVGSGTPPLPPAPMLAGMERAGAAFFVHEADFCPTSRVPVATIYHQRSNDPERRHFGLSKIAMMAVLTRSIIQILSWSMEDLESNLALLALPSKGGRPPTDNDGNPVVSELSATSILWFGSEAKHAPMRIQGDAEHIEIKFKLIENHVREILRLANLLGASAEAEKISSGVQGVVMRNELFRELKDYAGNLDGFTLEVLALAKSWATDEDWTVERLQESGKVSARFFKGPYATEPLEAVIKAAAAAIEMFRDVSPTACKAAWEQTARTLIPADDPALEESLEEIEQKGEGVLAAQSLQADVDAAEQAASDTETAMRDDLRTEKTSREANAA